CFTVESSICCRSAPQSFTKNQKREKEISSLEEIDQLLATDWDPYLTPEHARRFFEQVDSFEKMVYDNQAIQDNGVLTIALGWSGDLKP
ncbi:hypothetical protein, partial [Marinimicrobium locisalis]|uniref:hypothetical protein n=1 Tax=Marinimicrobium locisalis TaxID=546022 RepID=UPI003221D95F